jgi:glutamine cyclotransferase
VIRLVATAALLLAASSPHRRPDPAPVVTAEVIHAFPHDTSAFTEGLLVHDGALYESTGHEGQSVIRRVDLETGRTLAGVKLPPDVFGEGIAVWKDRLFSVTWHGGRGFTWSLPALRREGSFRYDGEGWAMTTTPDGLVLSDGTPVLRFLDPQTFGVVRRLTVTWQGVPLQRINELEYVDGEILANIWMKPLIARIDPASGVVTGWIDLSPIVAKLGLTNIDSVANGIAWDARRRRLYVTGKNWPKLFEIALPPRGGNGGR